MKDSANETFNSGLIAQYRDLIQEAILESESDHRTCLNLGRLNARLQVILRAAHYDGMPEELINQLIDESMPVNYVEKTA